MTLEAAEPAKPSRIRAFLKRFVRSVKAVLRRCGSFRGRASRLHYWSWMSAGFMAVVIGFAADKLLGMPDIVSFSNYGGLGPIAVTVLFLTLLPSWTVTVHRLHDVGLTGWFILFNLVPMIGDLLAVFLGLVPGQKKENRYGPPPVE